MSSAGTKKTLLKTIRITKELDSILQKDAKAKRTNVNALITSILTRYAEWDRYSERFGGSVSLRHDMLRDILEMVDDAAIVEAGREAGSRIQKEFLLFWFKKVDVESYLEYLSLVCRYGGVAQYELATDGREYIITLVHSMGEKWSLYCKGAVEGGMKATIGIIPKCEVTKNSLVIRFQTP